MQQKSWDALKQEQFAINLEVFKNDSGSDDDPEAPYISCTFRSFLVLLLVQATQRVQAYQ